MALFKNKYRIESTGLPGYDYFGEIVDSKMLLNEIGKFALHCWNGLPNHYENIILDEFVIMPNHVHGIIIITDLTTKKQKRHGLSESIRAFKSFSSRRINQLRKTPSQIWQSSFYNHVIRDENELNRIREYITDNPLRWELDNKNPKTFKHCKGTS